MAGNSATSSPGGKPAHMHGADCQQCGRIYFPLLLVRPTVVDMRYQGILKESGYVYASDLDSEFGVLKREGTVPAVRLLAEGFVLVFYKDRGKWDLWRSYNDGTLKKLLEQVTPDEYAKMSDGLKDDAKGSVCARGASNLPAGLITLVGPNTQSEIWLAYTPHLWAPQVLRDYTTDSQGTRATRMTEFAAKAWIEGGTLPAKGAMPLDADALQHNVIEFNNAVPKSGANQAAILPAFENALVPLTTARLGKAQAMVQAVRDIEKTAGPKSKDKALILMLQDPIGVVAEHNHIRLMALEAKKAWAAGAADYKGEDADPQRAWKLRSSLHAETIEGWAIAQAREEVRRNITREMNRNIPPMTEEEFNKRLASGKLPAGTTFEPIPFRDVDYGRILKGELPKSTERLDDQGRPVPQTIPSRDHPGQQTVLGYPRVPSADVKAVADRHYDGQTATGRRDRYREKLRFKELTDWRDIYKKASDRWDNDYIAKRETDYITWLKSPALELVMQNDFDWKINLAKIVPSPGTVAQQVLDVVARWVAVDKACGGGALGEPAAKFFVAMLDQPLTDPKNWADRALVVPFDAVDAVMSDPGKRKDGLEKLAGVLEVSAIVRESLKPHQHTLNQAAQSIAATKEQALNLATAALDQAKAKVAGIAKTDPAKLENYYRFHIRTRVLMEQVTRPDVKQPYVTVRFKIPQGDALDAVADALSKGQLEASMVNKSATTRAERRETGRSLRKLSGRPGLNVPESYPVMLTQDALERIQKQAARAGEELVEVVADDVLGGLKQPFKLPKSLATKLIGEQASTGRATLDALLDKEAHVVRVMAVFQVWALITSLKSLKNAQGYEYVDALMSVFSCVSGLVGGGLSVSMTVVKARTAGATLQLVPRAGVSLSSLRLASGLTAAAGSAFDAVGAFAKYAARKDSGDAQAANEYFRAGLMFAGSAGALALGAGALFIDQTGRDVAKVVAGVTARRFGVAIGLEAIGSALTGVGIVLGIVGFAWSLYALYMEDDLNDTFLKRSYWGIGDKPVASFGGASQASKDRSQILAWVKNGLSEEMEAFAGLTLGVKILVEWARQETEARSTLGTVVPAIGLPEMAYKYLTRRHVIKAKLSSASTGGNRRVSWSITVKDSDGKVLTGLADKDVSLKRDTDSGLQILEVVLPLDDAVYKRAGQAEFTYKLYEGDERSTLSGDTLRVMKD
ncbi:T6SS effector BTH_I2691 family protein [Ralstonia pseudosolanacearum]|uniref:T6SS effector BTH_I2691 family protein n=1 Tax=Ralstonia pseudosolanacearum TaxID=1310165 RepID=UPI003AAE3109